MVTAGIPFMMFVLFLLTGLTFVVLNDSYIRRGHRDALLLVILLCASLVVQNYLEDRIASGPPDWMGRTLAAVYGYAARPVVIALFISIIAPKKNRLPVWILIGVNALVHMTALFSGICFHISEDNHYSGGPLSGFCLWTSLALLAYLLFLTVHEYRKMPKKEMVIPVLTVVMILLSVWMDYQIGSEEQPIAYLTIAMTVSCVLYYIWLHTQFVREHEEDLKAQQRIRMMMAQIQPDFLYSTLSAIQDLCLTDPDAAADVTDEFSNYLRQNLNFLNEPGVIPFWKELDHTKAYVKIEEMQYPNIKVQYGIHDTGFSVPPMTLQPLVENAIHHGVSTRDEGIIQIFSRQQEDVHEVIVKDNGTGFDAASLQEESDTGHLGIRNVRERIGSLCGGTMQIDSEPDKGTTVTIRIPDRYTDE